MAARGVRDRGGAQVAAVPPAGYIDASSRACARARPARGRTSAADRGGPRGRGRARHVRRGRGHDRRGSGSGVAPPRRARSRSCGPRPHARRVSARVTARASAVLRPADRRAGRSGRSRAEFRIRRTSAYLFLLLVLVGLVVSCRPRLAGRLGARRRLRLGWGRRGWGRRGCGRRSGGGGFGGVGRLLLVALRLPLALVGLGRRGRAPGGGGGGGCRRRGGREGHGRRLGERAEDSAAEPVRSGRRRRLGCGAGRGSGAGPGAGVRPRGGPRAGGPAARSGEGCVTGTLTSVAGAPTDEGGTGRDGALGALRRPRASRDEDDRGRRREAGGGDAGNRACRRPRAKSAARAARRAPSAVPSRRARRDTPSGRPSH